MEAAGDEALLEFWALAQQLKAVKRQGWLDRGVTDPESAAEHSWGVALLAWLLARDEPDLDRDRVLLLGLVHGLPEALAGDPTPFDRYRDQRGAIEPGHFAEPPAYTPEDRQQKLAAERDALARMLAPVDPSLAAEVHDAWEDYESGRSPEARFVRQVDKLETLIQAEAYARRQPGLAIESFRLGAARDVTDRRLAPLVRLTRRP